MIEKKPPLVIFEVEGPPVTKELQAVFGFGGRVTGIVAEGNGTIRVRYEDIGDITFIPTTGKT